MITSLFSRIRRVFFPFVRTDRARVPSSRSLGVVILLLAWTTRATAQNSNLSGHDRYIHGESERNTRYFNNADSYPKPSANNFRSFVLPPVQSHDRADWGPQPSGDAVVQHQQTRAEYFAEVKQGSATGDAEAKMDLADCYYRGWGVAQNKPEAYRLYCEAGATRPRGLVTAAGLIFTGDGIAANQVEGLALMQRAAAAGDKSSADWLESVYPSANAIGELQRKSAAGDDSAKAKIAEGYAGQ